MLLTGAAGFIGSRVWTALAAAGHDVVAIDSMLYAAHGSGAHPPDGCRINDVRDPTRCRFCSKALMSCVTRPPLSGLASTRRDAPAYGSNKYYGTAVLLAQMYDAGCRRLVLASSMVVYGQGRYECRRHGPVDPLPPPRRPGCRSIRAPVPDRRRRAPMVHGWGRLAVTTAQSVRSEQDRAGTLRAGLGRRGLRLRHRAALPQRVRPTHAA
ncbi:NAD dependent epimerase/dehydratase family protein [Mycobacterium kansasii 824]|nr:NAD dependent epimerase/dehydratase family protein [Mycobacterium kansasii 824]